MSILDIKIIMAAPDFVPGDTGAPMSAPEAMLKGMAAINDATNRTDAISIII